MSDMNKAPFPAEVWVVCCPQDGKLSADFVASYRQAAMEHAAECAGGDITAEYGPYRVARYVLADAPAPEAQAQNAARYRWFLDECDQERRIEILEVSEGIADLIDHHIDKGRAGL